MYELHTRCKWTDVASCTRRIGNLLISDGYTVSLEYFHHISEKMMKQDIFLLIASVYAKTTIYTKWRVAVVRRGIVGNLRDLHRISARN